MKRFLWYFMIFLLLIINLSSIFSNDFDVSDDEFIKLSADGTVDEFSDDEFNDFQEIEKLEDTSAPAIVDSGKRTFFTKLKKAADGGNVLLTLILIIIGFISFYYKVKWIRYLTLLFSMTYLGFFIGGCPCSVGEFMKLFYIAVFRRAYILVPLLLTVVPLALTLIFGRIFCGYVCIIGAVQEFLARKGTLFEISYKTENKLKHVREIVFILFIIIIFIDNNKYNFCTFEPFKAVFTIGGPLLQVILAVIFLILSLFIYRPFCRYFCPYSLVLEFAGKISIYKLKKDPDHCTTCTACQSKCPMSAIDKDNNVDNGMCIRCTECLDCHKLKKKSGRKKR